MAAITEIANSYKQAIEQSGVKKVIHLSSIGAHTDKGNGMLAAHYTNYFKLGFDEHCLSLLPKQYPFLIKPLNNQQIRFSGIHDRN
ncbi:MAG: NAD-dependent epimerase/dehydratase family protein [Ferruginibacter sp.]|nr:NAD-dependent epimerase/dehydratase family protein [Ferruginibacter sp.]